MFSKPIPEMLDENDYKEIETIHTEMLNSFKYYLEGVKTSQFNVKDRTFLQKLISCPLDMELIGKLPIFFKDYWNSFTNVLMSGHEFIFLMNTINFINIFYVATRNIFMAVFIAMIITRLFIKNFADYMVKRNISKNTLIDDKFFNWSSSLLPFITHKINIWSWRVFSSVKRQWNLTEKKEIIVLIFLKGRW